MFALISNLLTQIVQVPVFISVMGVSVYGSYLVVIAVPALLTLSDLGLLAASSTLMMMHVAKANFAQAARVSGYTYNLLYRLLAVVATGMVVLGLLLPVGVGFSEIASRAIFIVYLVYALMLVYCTSVEGVMRAAGSYASAWNIFALLRLTDFAASAVALVLSKDLVVATVVMTLARFIGVIFLESRAGRAAPWRSRRLRRLDYEIARSLVAPMTASFAQPLANAALNQGLVLVVGTVLGPTAVVVLTTCKTATNAIRQVAQVLFNSALPELTVALSTNRVDLAIARFRRVVLWAGICCGGAAVAEVLIGPWVVSVWTHGHVHPDYATFTLFVVQVVIECAWLTASALLVSQNAHFGFTVVYAIGACIVLGLIFVLRADSLAGVMVIQSVMSSVVLVFVIWRTRVLMAAKASHAAAL